MAAACAVVVDLAADRCCGATVPVATVPAAAVSMAADCCSVIAV